MNISELARHLEVSPSTVSRVLSGNAEKYRISAPTVERVLAAAALHRVQPDLLGSSLRRGKLGMVGLLLPDITNPFFAELARAIEREVRHRGMTLQLGDSAEDEATELDLLRQMLGRRLDGMILVPVASDLETMDPLVNQAPFPVVIVDRILPGLDAPSIGIDNHQAGHLAASSLVEAGHRRIGCLRGDPESHIDRERFRGVVDALEEAGLEMAPARVAGEGYSLEAALHGVRRILETPAPPEALLTLSGQGILAALQVASERKIRIPEQLSIIAFDEQPWSAFMNPPITTVVQPVDEMAHLAVTGLIEPPETPLPRLEAHLRERDSVRRLRARE